MSRAPVASPTAPACGIRCPSVPCSGGPRAGLLASRMSATRFLRYLAPNLITAVGVVFGLLSLVAAVEGRYVDAAWIGGIQILDGHLAPTCVYLATGRPFRCHHPQTGQRKIALLEDGQHGRPDGTRGTDYCNVGGVEGFHLGNASCLLARVSLEKPVMLTFARCEISNLITLLRR